MSSRSTRARSGVAVQVVAPVADRSRSRSKKKKSSSDRAVDVADADEGQPAAGDDAALARALAESDLAERERKLKEQQEELQRQRQELQQLRPSPVASPQQSPQLSPQLSPQQSPRSRGVNAAAAANASAAAAEPSSRFAKKEPRAQDLQEYDGAAGAKLDDWLKQLAMAARLYHLNQLETVDFGTARLRGAALDWWLSLSCAELTDITTAGALTVALRARFQPVTAARTAREQLDKLMQGSRSVNEYIADFQRLSTQIGLSSLGEENALYAFERGLRRDIAVELRKQNVVTLQGAIALAARIGGLIAGSNTPAGRTPNANQMEIDSGDGSDSRLDRIEAALNALTSAQGGTPGMGAKTQTQRGYQQDRNSRGGFRGGRGGRFGGRGGASSISIPGVPAEVVEQRRSAGQCFRCGSADHRSLQCPNAISASGN